MVAAGPTPAWTPGAALADDDITGERYVPERHRGTSVEIEHQARYRWAATLVEGKEVLDAGCGTGWGAGILARAGAARVIGVDRSELAITHGQAGLEDLVELRLGDLCALDLPDESFDVVVCFEAIEHLEDPSSALDHFRRVLRPDGLLIVSTPVRGVYPAGNPFHVHEYEAGELEAALRRRFDHVRADRQHTQAATLLVDDRTMAEFNVARPLDLDVRKVEGVPPGKELYTVVSASDAALPPPPRLAVVGEALDFRSLLEELRAAGGEIDIAEGRASFAEMHLHLLREMHEAEVARVQAAERAAAASLEAQHIAEARLASVVQSRSWRWMAPLRAGVRRARQRKNP
jgi:SAM-dependent methyltransferase